jgi:hypothetical protein
MALRAKLAASNLIWIFLFIYLTVQLIVVGKMFGGKIKSEQNVSESGPAAAEIRQVEKLETFCRCCHSAEHFFLTNNKTMIIYKYKYYESTKILLALF